MKKNCILILLDSITFDTLNDSKISKKLFPNLDYLAQKYKFKKCVSHSNCTQFVLPSLFSMTMPLDEGGYDYGVKHRNTTFMEILKKEGFKTLIFSNCNQMGADNGYDRGVDENINSFDYRLILEQKINRVILSKFKKNKNLNKNEELINEYKKLLINIKEKIEDADTLIWSKKLIKINNYIFNNINVEISLVDKEPDIILKKLISINPASIWKFLGDKHLEGFNFWKKRLLTSLNWRIKYFVTKSFVPINLLNHATINIVDKLSIFKKKFLETKKPLFIYHHIMDLHDYQNFNSVNFFIRKLKKFPRWYINSFKLKRKRHFLYDSTLMLIDDYIGEIIKILDKDTFLFVTSDHGHRKSLKKKIKRKYITDDYFNEMHGEDIEVPLVSNTNIEIDKNNKSNLLDTITITKKILFKLNIDISKYIKLKNYDYDFIISEHSGRGSFDLNKNMYFTISNNYYRMLVAFLENELFIKLYNIKEDIDETNDISNKNENSEVINNMFNYLKKNRKDIILNKLKLISKVHNNFLKID